MGRYLRLRLLAFASVALYLVTGGAGFIGSHITEALVARGDRVRILDNLSSGKLENLGDIERGAVGSGSPIEFLEGDITDPKALEIVCAGVQGAFHKAAQVSVPLSVQDPKRSYELNVMGTLGLLEACRSAGVKKLVFAASSAIYGDSEELPKVETMVPNPLSPYGSGKLAGEHLMSVWAHTYGMQTVSLRYFNIFGPRQADDSPYSGVIAIFARKLLEGVALKIYGDGEQTRDFTHVRNVVQANLLAIDSDGAPARVYNIGTGVQVSVNQLLARMAELIGNQVQPEYVDSRAGDIRHSVSSPKLAMQELGYDPKLSWREGLVETVEWYRERWGAALS